MLNFNEGKVCDAIVRNLEAREKAQRSNLRWPEDEAHAAPVELVFTLGREMFALEHTGIEPFTGHMQMENQSDLHFTPITDALKGALDPSAVFELHIPARAFQALSKRDVCAIQAALVTWIKAEAAKLPIRRYGDYKGYVSSTSLPGVPFPVSLFRFETVVQPGHFQIKHLVQGNLDQIRSDRIKTACDKKFPKLAAWKRDEGARTILILEDNDIFLTNQAIVSDAYLPLALARTDRPDETYLVATCMDPWHAWPVLIDRKSYFDLAQEFQANVGWSIDQHVLIALTKR